MKKNNKANKKKPQVRAVDPAPDYIGTVPIHCRYDRVLPLAEIRPNPRNPNRHPPEQIALLAKVISAAGWRAPITVSKRSGLIVMGHGRLEAAVKAGLAVAPVELQEFASDADEMAQMIADNRLAELAEIDLPGLKDLLQELDSGAFDMELTGFDAAALEGLMTACAPVELPSIEDADETGMAMTFRFDLVQLQIVRTAMEIAKDRAGVPNGNRSAHIMAHLCEKYIELQNG